MPFRSAKGETFREVPALLGIPTGEACETAADVIRSASHSLGSYSVDAEMDLADIVFTDYGNLVLPNVSREEAARLVGDASRAILGTEAIPVIFGGDGSYSPGAVSATLDRFPNLTVLQVGASPNLSAEVSGDKWHPSCATTRILDRLPADQLIQFGIREGKKKEFPETHEYKRPGAISELAEQLPDGPIYLSFQLSAFEPSFVTATGIHEPGGLFWNDFRDLVKAIPWGQIHGLDFSGLFPDTDMTGYPSLVAAKVMREFLLHLPQPTKS